MTQKFRIVNNWDSKCWDPARYLGGCAGCKRVDRCKLDEGHNGRVENQKTKIADMKRQYEEFPDKISEQEQVLKDMEGE